MVIEVKDFPWPQKGDNLFVGGEDWYYNAVLNGQHDNLSLYAVGYKKAGEMLVEAVVKSRKDHDSLQDCIFCSSHPSCAFLGTASTHRAEQPCTDIWPRP
jgi:hypothetical protein